MIKTEKKVPKYVMNLLRRREKLAMDLMDVCGKLETYCEKIGVDMVDDASVLGSHIMIYCEPQTAYAKTLVAIKETLNKGEKNEGS